MRTENSARITCWELQSAVSLVHRLDGQPVRTVRVLGPRVPEAPAISDTRLHSNQRLQRANTQGGHARQREGPARQKGSPKQFQVATMPEFIAVACCECRRFQVQQVKKRPTFTCPVCNVQQTVKRVYCRALQARPVREAVAALNKQLGAGEQQLAEDHEGERVGHQENAASQQLLCSAGQPAPSAAWDDFVEEDPGPQQAAPAPSAVGQIEMQMFSTEMFSTEMPAAGMKVKLPGRPRKRRQAEISSAAQMPGGSGSHTSAKQPSPYSTPDKAPSHERGIHRRCDASRLPIVPDHRLGAGCFSGPAASFPLVAVKPHSAETAGANVMQAPTAGTPAGWSATGDKRSGKPAASGSAGGQGFTAEAGTSLAAAGTWGAFLAEDNLDQGPGASAEAETGFVTAL